MKRIGLFISIRTKKIWKSSFLYKAYNYVNSISACQRIFKFFVLLQIVLSSVNKRILYNFIPWEYFHAQMNLKISCTSLTILLKYKSAWESKVQIKDKQVILEKVFVSQVSSFYPYVKLLWLHNVFLHADRVLEFWSNLIFVHRLTRLRNSLNV